jgi:hypothetical protein
MAAWSWDGVAAELRLANWRPSDPPPDSRMLTALVWLDGFMPMWEEQAFLAGVLIAAAVALRWSGLHW